VINTTATTTTTSNGPKGRNDMRLLQEQLLLDHGLIKKYST
jgi:hypothetical protein